ncbi:MAG: ABC transporter permease [Eubacteriales bacterium]|nr:ABC transporter permease [Eubacteriales bacterium]
MISLGSSLLITAKETGEKVDKAITTIAVPNVVKIREDSGGNDAWVVDGKFVRTSDNFDEIRRADRELYNLVMETGIEAGIGAKDPRSSYYAYSKDLSPLLQSEADLNLPHNVAVFEVVCKSIEELNLERPDFYPKSEHKMHQIEWSVLKAIALHPSYETPETMLTSAYIHGLEMGVPIEAGKRYLIAGDISNAKRLDEKEKTEIPVYFHFFVVRVHEGVLLEEGTFIPYTELKDGMDVDEFLRLKEGSDFKKLVDNCTSIIHSTNVITTDSLNSVLQFNMRKAYIVKGREITPEEYEQGQRVCVISSEFAEYNKVNIGDNITLSLANASYYKMMYRAETAWLFEVQPFFIQFSEGQPFKVVGIYQPPEWKSNEYVLSPNTIFVPSKSVDIVAEDQSSILMDRDVAPILYSLIIPNGKLEAFKAEMGLQGMEQYFLYYDQGYSYLTDVIETLSKNAIIIFIICVFVWISVLVLFLLLYVIREKQIAGIMLSLGTGVKRTFQYLFITCLLLAIPSTLSSTVLGYAFEGKVTEISYELAIDQSSFNESFSDLDSSDQGYNPFNKEVDTKGEYRNSLIHLNSKKTALMIGALQFMLILSAGAVSICILVKKRPMQLVNSKEG